jgi:hypothetical protein
MLHFTSPAEKWATQPSFLIGEYFFYAAALVALWHAWRSGRRHLCAWLGALLAGTANDLLFMALPLVDNFWQAQATVMLTPRLPLYIPCVYVCFLYYPTVCVWRLGLPPFARAAATGLAAAIFYAPYDIVGAKFLWWTWHDTDPPIANRILGAPIGSTMWVITFAASFAALLGAVLDRDEAVRRRTFVTALGLVVVLSSLSMVLQMTALQQLDGGAPGIRGLVVVILVYAIVIQRGARRGRRPQPLAANERPIAGVLAAHFALFAIVLGVFDPQSHLSESVHQTYGPCHVAASDLTGHTRYRYLCAEDFDEDFTFDCVRELPALGSDWYTVCGRAHRGFAAWLTAVAGLGVVGIALYAYLLGFGARRKPE